MISSAFVTDSLAAIAPIASVGPSWTIVSWAPFTLIREALKQDQDVDDEKGQRSGSDDSGSIIGLHNIAMSTPQILAVGVCYAILSVADEVGSLDGIGWVFRISGITFLAAAILAWKLGRDA